MEIGQVTCSSASQSFLAPGGAYPGIPSLTWFDTGSFQEWADIEAHGAVLRRYEPLVVRGLLQTEDYAGVVHKQSPDELANALALCTLHRALFDGITEDRRIRVSSLYVARNEAGIAVDALARTTPLISRPQQPKVDVIHISWHQDQVFKEP